MPAPDSVVIMTLAYAQGRMWRRPAHDVSCICVRDVVMALAQALRCPWSPPPKWSALPTVTAAASPPPRHLERHPIPWLAAMLRTAVDHHRRSVHPASEVVRCMRPISSAALGGRPQQPKRLRGDRAHRRVEVQRHHMIAFQPRLESDMAPIGGRPPAPAFSGGPRRRVSGNAVVCARQVLSAWTLAWATRVVQGGALVRVTTLWWSG
jgi:hypothetical protein